MVRFKLSGRGPKALKFVEIYRIIIKKKTRWRVGIFVIWLTRNGLVITIRPGRSKTIISVGHMSYYHWLYRLGNWFKRNTVPSQQDPLKRLFLGCRFTNLLGLFNLKSWGDLRTLMESCMYVTFLIIDWFACKKKKKIVYFFEINNVIYIGVGFSGCHARQQQHREKNKDLSIANQFVTLRKTGKNNKRWWRLRILQFFNKPKDIVTPSLSTATTTTKSPA